MLSLPPFEYLPTFARKPSWVNKAGRVDRSACLEIRASELWRLKDSSLWQHVCRDGGLQAFTVITLSAFFIDRLQRTRLPHTLSGDLRTPKSNAMKRDFDAPPNQRRKHLKPHEARWAALPDLNDSLYGNPNKGATQTKELGLRDLAGPHVDSPWKQQIRIERWKRERKRSSAGGQPSTARLANVYDPLGWSQAGVRSSVRHGRSTNLSPPNFRHYLICPVCRRKMAKLMMVVAQRQELQDAATAEGWIKMLDARLAAMHRTPTLEFFRARAAIIDRYGLLFRDRRLVCRNCLGVRYGEVKKSRCKHDAATGALRRANRRAAAQAAFEASRAAEMEQSLRKIAQFIPPQCLEQSQREVDAWRAKKAKRAAQNERQRERRAKKRLDASR